MFKYNTMGARIGAAIVDYVIICVPLSFMHSYITEEFSANLAMLIFWTIMGSSVFQCYAILMHGRYGQTVGKRSMSIKIVQYPEESPITYRHAFIRDLPYTILLLFYIVLAVCFLVAPELNFNSSLSAMLTILDFASFFWFLLEIISMFFNDKKRAIHDIIAKTVVINVEATPKPQQ